MLIEEISGGDGVVEIPSDRLELDVQCESIDFKIHSKERPKICTAFKAIRLLDEKRAIIVLSDGSQWNIVAKDVSKVFKAISTEWKVGDDIRIGDDSDRDVFVLKNVRNGAAYLVELSDKCADISKAVFIKAVDESGYAIITSDDRIWVTGYLGACTTQYWQEGDRVIINKGGHDNRYGDYDVINARDASNVWVTQVFEDQTKLASSQSTCIQVDRY